MKLASELMRAVGTGTGGGRGRPPLRNASASTGARNCRNAPRPSGATHSSLGCWVST